MMSLSEHFLFVHIPKTAGTSFRTACEHYFGEENCLHDYSLHSTKTSQVVKDIIYTENDYFKLFEWMQQREKLLLSGHFHVNKYMPLFYSLHVISFVRHPLQQVLSHYRHHCRDLGYKHDLKTFIQDKRFKNLQSRLLAAKPLELYGFIGLTEEYDKSIEMLNDYYDLNLEVLYENSDIGVEVEVNEALLELILRENEQDMKMYEKVKKIFYERYDAFKKNSTWQHILVQEENDTLIRGICVEKDSNKPAEVVLIVGNKKVKIKANLLRPGYIVHNLGRNGFVGFKYSGEI